MLSCFNNLSYFLVENGYVTYASNLLKKTKVNSLLANHSTLQIIIQYNLGILEYAIGKFKEGIHNIEEANQKLQKKCKRNK